MKPHSIARLVLIVSGSCLLGIACNVQNSAPGSEVYVDSAPPPLQVEVEPPAPGVDFVWIGGNWFWEEGRWQWHAGRWDHPPHPGAHFEANHYESRNGHHVYVRGGWR